MRGAYDNIEALTALKNKHNFWLHGGAAIMSLKLKKKFLAGIEYLDSFTMDFHKILGSNLMCNFLLLNHQYLLSCICADGNGSYIFRDNGVDFGIASLQCGRRVDSLKWFLDWKFYTKQGFSDRVESYHQLAKPAENFINASVDLEMILKRTSFNVCFRFKTKHPDKNNFNQRLRDSLYQEQHALLSLTYVEKN